MLVVIDCKIGEHLAGETVELDDIIAEELVGIGRAKEVKPTTVPEKKKGKK